MRKKILCAGVLALSCVLSPFYSFAEPAEGTEEQTEAVEAVDYETADILVMEFRVIPVQEILDAYFGKGKWDTGCLKENVFDSEGYSDYTYKTDEISLTYTAWGNENDPCIGCSDLLVSFPGERPEEEEMKAQWEELFTELSLPLTGEYRHWKEKSSYPDYEYWVEADGVQICPDNYTMGDRGNETDFYGSRITVTVTEDGYRVDFNHMRTIEKRAAVDSPRKLHTKEEIRQLVYETLEGEGWGLKLGEDLILDEESEVCVPVYFMVDLGGNIWEGVYDIVYYYKINVQGGEIDGEDIPMCVEAYVDGVFPYLYTSLIGADYSRYYEAETKRMKGNFEER